MWFDMAAGVKRTSETLTRDCPFRLNFPRQSGRLVHSRSSVRHNHMHVF
jgi:hypothetical protein